VLSAEQKAPFFEKAQAAAASHMMGKESSAPSIVPKKRKTSSSMRSLRCSALAQDLLFMLLCVHHPCLHADDTMSVKKGKTRAAGARD
jgi:hypothetical protein